MCEATASVRHLKQRLFQNLSVNREISPCTHSVRLVEMTADMGKERAAHYMHELNQVHDSAAGVNLTGGVTQTFVKMGV